MKDRREPWVLSWLKTAIGKYKGTFVVSIAGGPDGNN